MKITEYRPKVITKKWEKPCLKQIFLKKVLYGVNNINCTTIICAVFLKWITKLRMQIQSKNTDEIAQ